MAVHQVTLGLSFTAAAVAHIFPLPYALIAILEFCFLTGFAPSNRSGYLQRRQNLAHRIPTFDVIVHVRAGRQIQPHVGLDVVTLDALPLSVHGAQVVLGFRVA